MGERLVFGEVIWCPRCRGSKSIKELKGETVRQVVCPRCKGEGIVPNDEPIAPIRRP